MNEQTAAKKISISVEKLIEWEKGSTQPTINQAQKLARVYRRPFALFFLPEVPKDFKPLEDFRKTGSEELSTSAVFIIREIRQKQAWVREAYENEGRGELPFIGRFSLANKPHEVASDIINVLGIAPPHYSSGNPFYEWIDGAETNGIFITRTSFIHSKLLIDPDLLQGFAIADRFAPFVYINSDDWNTAQLFTLVHELAHLWIAESGLSNAIDYDYRSVENRHPVESFCNEVAAHALMPEDQLRNENLEAFSELKGVSSLAKRYGVSSFALLIRLHNLKLLTSVDFKKLKLQATEQYQDFLAREEAKKIKQKEKTGGPNYFLLQLNRNSRLFTQTVLDAFRGGHINPTLASDLLNVQITKFNKLEVQLYR